MTRTDAVPPAATPTPRAAGADRYFYSIGYLRAFIVMLVVADHSVLAYDPLQPLPAVSLLTRPRVWQMFPVDDPHKWKGFAAFAIFNDTTLISVMFFLSGLFVWQSLRRKGSGKFVRDRLLRLGVPFVLAAGIVAPLAYAPAYLLTPQAAGIAGFWHIWLSLRQWPPGAAWFIWVLLAFDLLSALLFVSIPNWGAWPGKLAAGAARRPAVFLATLAVLSAFVYLPMASRFTAENWWDFGPLNLQKSRVFHYLLYFLAGTAVGAWGLSRGLLSEGGNLRRRWLLWVMAAPLVFGATLRFTLTGLRYHTQSRPWVLGMYTGFSLVCAVSCFAFLAFFLRFAQTRSRLFESLNANSYGIYLTHYACVSWLQYVLLPAALPAIVKAVIVFLGALSLSWGMAATLRRIPAVARVI